MHSRQLLAVAVTTCVLALNGCGHKSKTFDEMSIRREPVVGNQVRTTFANPLNVADEALFARRDAERRFVEASIWLAAAVPQPAPDHAAGGLSEGVAPAAASTSSPWGCIATAETGDIPAPGPTYWTEFGVVRDVIEDYGTPEEQAAIFGMTADAATRLAPVARFAAKNGFGGWGSLTRQKCNL